MKMKFMVGLMLLIMGSLAFANANATYASPTPANNTWRNGTQGLSLITINVTANSTIIANASTYIQWWNETNASTNVSGISAQKVNGTFAVNDNWIYWQFNITNDGVHRFEVQVLTNTSTATGLNITSNITNGGNGSRFIYMDNTSTGPMAIGYPVNNTDYIRSPPENLTFDLNFTGHDLNRDRCLYDINNQGNRTITSCANSSLLIVAQTGSNTLILWTNDSAGNSNSTYITFTARESSVGGGGGGGGSPTSVQVTRVTLGSLPANAIQVVPVTGNTPVNRLEFKTTAATSFSMDIEKLTSFPVADAPGIVFDRMNLKPSTTQGITDFVIHFKVSKFSLQEKGVASSNVVLMRYQNSWFTLPTEKTGEDAIFVYFKATTPGFSYFAITSGSQATSPQYQIQPTGEASGGVTFPDLGNINLGNYQVPIMFLIMGSVVLVAIIWLVRR